MSKHKGKVIPRKLNFKLKKDRALRAFVYRRDNFTCQQCGVCAESNGKYTGRYTLTASNGEYLVIDHKIPRKAGGKNSPCNLQTLCDKCNKVKGNTADVRLTRTLGGLDT